MSEEIRSWLRGVLSQERTPTEVVMAGAQRGYLERSLRKAKVDLGVESVRTREGWFWRLPAKSSPKVTPGLPACPEVNPVSKVEPEWKCDHKGRRVTKNEYFEHCEDCGALIKDHTPPKPVFGKRS
jgi:hypothetical protein